MLQAPVAPHRAVPRLNAVGRLTTNPKPLLSVQLGFDSSDYMLRDLVLNCEKVLHLSVVFFGPQMASSFRFDQLSCYADAVSCGSYTSFENVADAEVTPDLSHINGA